MNRLPIGSLATLMICIFCDPGFAVAESKAPTISAVGTSAQPIKCDGVAGERRYLSRLRDAAYKPLSWKRIGSFGGNKEHDHLLDKYVSNGGHEIALDMYFPGFIDIRCPPGLHLLTEFSDTYEYIAGRIHKIGIDEPFSGLLEVKYSTGQMHRKATLTNGFITDQLTEFYKSGKVRWKRRYAGTTNLRSGPETWYYENGQIWAKMTHHNGYLQGKYETFYEDGSIKLQSHYDKGLEHGKRIDYFPNGTIKATGTLVKGKWKGPFTTYKEDGSVDRDEVID